MSFGRGAGKAVLREKQKRAVLCDTLHKSPIREKRESLEKRSTLVSKFFCWNREPTCGISAGECNNRAVE
jgi:hypothetical protein